MRGSWASLDGENKERFWQDLETISKEVKALGRVGFTKQNNV